MLENIKKTTEYIMISEFYGDKKAKRSQVPLINHIDEGIIVLREVGGTQLSARAFCLHPIFQGDAEFMTTLNSDLIQSLPVDSVALAVEYRNVANAYLSKRIIKDTSEIHLSPLWDVIAMLIADKVQNYKDFELYHQGTHERSIELTVYFKNWLSRLGVPGSRYHELKDILIEYNKTHPKP